MAEEGVRTHQTVVVSNGRIMRIGPASQTPIPPGTTRIDGRGKVLMPGLGDAHAHLSTVGGGPALAGRALDLYPLFGVTTIRSMYTEPHHRPLLANAAGRVWPRVVVASPAFTGQSTPTPQAARDSVRKYKAEGFAFTKVLPGLSRPTFDTLAAESKALGMPLAGHVPAAVGLEQALQSGFVSIEHLDGLMEALLPPGTQAQAGFFGLGLIDRVDEGRLAEVVRQVKASGVVVVPTEMAMERYVSTDSGTALARRPEMRHVPMPLLQAWIGQKDNFARGVGVTAARAARYRALRRRFIRELHAAGVPIALGSDAFNLFDVPGASIVEELTAFVDAGMTPRAALRSATVEVARLMNIPHVTGTVSVGAVADLVLLEGDPLLDLRHVAHPAGVMLNGRWLDRAEMDRRLRALEVPSTGH